MVTFQKPLVSFHGNIRQYYYAYSIYHRFQLICLVSVFREPVHILSSDSDDGFENCKMFSSSVLLLGLWL